MKNINTGIGVTFWEWLISVGCVNGAEKFLVKFGLFVFVCFIIIF